MKKLINWIIIALAFLLPLFFLPITAEFYLFNKQTLLVFATGVLLVLWALRLAEEKSFSFKKTPLDLPILLFALAHVLATLFVSPNKVEALMGATSTGMILALTALYFVITNNMAVYGIQYTVYSSIASAAVLGLVAIYQFVGLGEAIAPVDWMKGKLWTPTGGPLILLAFLGVNLFLALVLFLRRLNHQDWFATAWIFVANLLIALGLLLTIYQVLPGKDVQLMLPPFKEGWVVAIEAFKQSPLLGVGPNNYLSAFSRFRSIAFNNSDFWNTRFGNASSFPFEVLTIGGILALVAYFFLVLRAVRLLLSLRGELGRDDYKQAVLVGLLALLAVQFLFPINFLILVATFIFLALLSLSQAREHLRGTNDPGSFSETKPSLDPGSKKPLGGEASSRAVLGTVAALVLAIFYLWGRAYAADMAFRQSLNALAENRGADTYNLQIKAIDLNPYKENYRVAYSQTNFALANSLAGSPRFAGEAGQLDLTDQDRANITRLIQQAIREAKTATVLNRTNAVYWENLALTYRNLINFAQGSDQWAIAAYQQAIFLDPVNPLLRVNLGGLFYGLGEYEEAVRHFQNSINLKPDYANGYYNLASAYREQERYQEAFNVMQIVVNLVPADSADYQRAIDELEELREKLPAAEATPAAAPAGPEELTPPEPLPSPVIEPPIELPEEAGPEISPAPSPEPTLEATPTP